MIVIVTSLLLVTSRGFLHFIRLHNRRDWSGLTANHWAHTMTRDVLLRTRARTGMASTRARRPASAPGIWRLRPRPRRRRRLPTPTTVIPRNIRPATPRPRAEILLPKQLNKDHTGQYQYGTLDLLTANANASTMWVMNLDVALSKDT